MYMAHWRYLKNSDDAFVFSKPLPNIKSTALKFPDPPPHFCAFIIMRISSFNFQYLMLSHVGLYISLLKEHTMFGFVYSVTAVR